MHPHQQQLGPPPQLSHLARAELAPLLGYREFERSGMWPDVDWTAELNYQRAYIMAYMSRDFEKQQNPWDIPDWLWSELNLVDTPEMREALARSHKYYDHTVIWDFCAYQTAPPAQQVQHAAGRLRLFDAVERDDQTLVAAHCDSWPGELPRRAAPRPGGETLWHCVGRAGSAQTVSLTLPQADARGRDDLVRGAVCAGQIATLDLVHTQGTDLRKLRFDNGDTALHVAAQAGQVEVVQYLCGVGCNASLPNYLEETALHILTTAPRLGARAQRAIATVLVLAGADLEHCTRTGDTAPACGRGTRAGPAGSDPHRTRG